MGITLIPCKTIPASARMTSSPTTARVVVNGSRPQLGNNEKARISLGRRRHRIDLTVGTTGARWSHPDGRYVSVPVRVIDNAGNVGATDSRDVVIDLTKPAAATITVDSVSQDTGPSDSDFITSETTRSA